MIRRRDADVWERLPGVLARLKAATAELEQLVEETRREVPARPQGDEEDVSA
jgi:hypothetical protein